MKVFANGMAISREAGDGKLIAAFPDVCLSPPPPPAGPVPVPYPNSAFSKDLKKGSKSVTVDGKPLALKDQSFFKSSPLGNEAATRNFGGSVASHTITGKAYFNSWSMDVKVEGKNVTRHLDLMTSNHASYPGSTPPFTEMEEMALLALSDTKEDLCPCCWQPGCTAAMSKSFPNGKTREAFSFREWYQLDEKDASGAPTATAQARSGELAALPCSQGNCPNAGKQERKSDPPCDVYRVTTSVEAHKNVKGVRTRRKQELRRQFGVPQNVDELARNVLGNPAATEAMLLSTPGWNQRRIDKALQIDHRTPRSAGGCPTSENNTVANAQLCKNCIEADLLLDKWNNDELTSRRAMLGI
ncbi:DUF4150 domain-containing protein [Pyxidicoccus fallax]|uniref:DUF4150 domain-containing protein n=1 Tax=Pyxidicoccus fallax TaxID=394095 RepID=A0A848LRV3_9BACT|nr:DUF4150 domain-containing protein [Pyxidicoccus fallax]NMO20362.1 DUF4150 domain-containing protein [Pyxidicoccus fallax]NPC82763.1 DUF4150 domain-containing protein [Pyxidicoccus fallax]